MPQKSLTELKAMLAAEKADALAADQSSRLSSERTRALNYYMGDVSQDIPSVVGRSSVVSSDVSDTIEGLMPALMEIFAGDDEVVKFTPTGPEDVKAAEQETDYVNHVFMQQNRGFRVLYSFIKDALLSKVGIVKVWTEEEEKEDRETYYDQPDEAFALISSTPGIEVVEHSEHDGLHDITIVTRKTIKKHKVEPVPPEEFGISRRAKTIEDAPYVFHETTVSVGELIDQGYDADIVKTLPSDQATSTERLARDTVDEHTGAAGDEGMNDMVRPVLVTEHYVRMDYREDGKAALYRIITGGTAGDVLTKGGKECVDPVDYAPFAAATPIVVTHRFFGRSVADLVMDIMRIKTALVRGMLDNLYLHNNPRPVVAQSGATKETLDDLLVSRIGSPIRTKMPGTIEWQVVPDITGSIFPALEYWDATREWRTGVTRQGQGLDAQAIANQTATAANQVFTMAQARVRLIARLIAEGVRDLFALLHAEVRKNGDQAAIVRLRNEWVQVDPRDWKERNDMTINVGLGTGGKQQQLANLMQLMGLQQQAMAAGLTNLVGPKNLYSSAKVFCQLAEYKNVEDFFLDPDKQPAPQQPPDPKMMELQAKNQLETQKAQVDFEHQKAQAQSEIAIAERKAQLDERKMVLEMEIKQREHQMNMASTMAKATAQPRKTKTKNADGSVVEEQAPAVDHTAPMLAMLMEHMQKANGPKRIVRDDQGRVVGVEPVSN